MKRGEGNQIIGGMNKDTGRENDHIRWFEGLSLLMGILMIASSFLLFQSNWLNTKNPLPWVYLSSGIFLITVTVLAIDRNRLPVVQKYCSTIGVYLDVHDWQCLFLLASIFSVILAVLASGSGLVMNNAPLAVISWALAIGFAFLGGWVFDQSGFKSSRKTAGLFLVIAAAAFLIRAVDTIHVPPVLSGDEASSGLSAVLFLNGKMNNIFTTGWFSFPSFFFYVQSRSISLLGNTITALRLPSAVVGALTAGAVFVLARAMFGTWAGLYAGIFLTGFHFHNHFSRIGLNNIWDGFWYTAVLGTFWWGWHKKQRAYFLMSGLCLGISQYFYVSARILFLVPIAWIGVNFLVDSRKVKTLIPDILLFLLLALLAFFPLGVFYLRYPAEFSAPLRRVTIFGSWLLNETQRTGLPAWRILLQQIAAGYQGYVIIPIRMWYNPETPLLRPASATLFIFGVLMLFLRARDQRLLMLLLWILPFGLIAGLSESTPAAQRYTAVAPALAIVIGYGLYQGAKIFRRIWKRAGIYINIAVLFLVLVLAAEEINFYYFQHTRSGEFGGENNLVAQRLADFLQEKDNGWNIYFFGMPRMGYYSYSTLPYLAPQVTGYDMNYPWGSDQNPTVVGRKIDFVFLPNHREDLTRAQQDYSGGTLFEERNEDGEILYWLYEFLDQSKE